MKWPKLVPKKVCKTPVRVYLDAGIGEDGAPVQRLIFEGMCSYSERSRQVLDEQRRLIQLEASALFDGDIAPGEERISGKAVIGGGTLTRIIFQSRRARNPDGTVNFTQLELM